MTKSLLNADGFELAEKQEIMDDEDIQLAENRDVPEDEADDLSIYVERRSSLERTKIVKQIWSIREIYQKIKIGDLILDPAYQRNDIWPPLKKTAFIESLFMGIVIPPIYVVELEKSSSLDNIKYEVVDGKQRLSTIKLFIENELKLDLKALEYYRDIFKNKKFSDIEKDYNPEVNEMLSSVLDVYVITSNSPELTKYDIFSRLNKGSEKLKVNEIRKAIYRSKTLLAIENYVDQKLDKESPDVVYKAVFSNNDIKRYEDFGRFYRSISFYCSTDIASQAVLDYNSRPREMINSTLDKIKNGAITISEEELKQILDCTLELLVKLQKNAMSNYIIDSLIYFYIKYPELVNEKFEEIINDENYNKTFEKSPSTTSNVNERIKCICRILGVDGVA